MHTDPAAVAADLEAWCRPGGILDKDGDRASIHLFDPVARRRTRDAIVDAYLAEQTDVGVGRHFCAAIISAGPPGCRQVDRRSGNVTWSTVVTDTWMRTSSRTNSCAAPSRTVNTRTCCRRRSPIRAL